MILKEIFDELAVKILFEERERTVLWDYIMLCADTVDQERKYYSSLHSNSENEYLKQLDQDISKKLEEIKSFETNSEDTRLIESRYRSISRAKKLKSEMLNDKKGIHEKYLYYFNIHKNSDHKFYEALKKTTSHKLLTEKFLEKNAQPRRVFKLPDNPIKQKTPPLPRAFYFNYYVARSILQIKQVLDRGVESYIENNTTLEKEQRIISLATKLLDELQDGTESTRRKTDLNALTRLASGNTTNNSFAKKESWLNIKKNHLKAERELITKILCYKYMQDFVIQNEKKPLNEYKESEKERLFTYEHRAPDFNTAYKFLADYSKKNTNGIKDYVTIAKNGLIQPDIIADLVMEFTGDLIEERQVQKIKKKILDDIDECP